MLLGTRSQPKFYLMFNFSYIWITCLQHVGIRARASLKTAFFYLGPSHIYCVLLLASSCERVAR